MTVTARTAVAFHQGVGIVLHSTYLTSILLFGMVNSRFARRNATTCHSAGVCGLGLFFDNGTVSWKDVENATFHIFLSLDQLRVHNMTNANKYSANRSCRSFMALTCRRLYCDVLEVAIPETFQRSLSFVGGCVPTKAAKCEGRLESVVSQRM